MSADAHEDDSLTSGAMSAAMRGDTIELFLLVDRAGRPNGGEEGNRVRGTVARVLARHLK
jgi:hypothetical protein